MSHLLIQSSILPHDEREQEVQGRGRWWPQPKRQGFPCELICGANEPVRTRTNGALNCRTLRQSHFRVKRLEARFAQNRQGVASEEDHRELRVSFMGSLATSCKSIDFARMRTPQ